MLKKRLGVELMVTKLPQIEVLQRHDKTIAMACRDAGTTEPLRDECLIGEIFYGLREAQIIIENWRIHYDTKHPHPRHCTGGTALRMIHHAGLSISIQRTRLLAKSFVGSHGSKMYFLTNGRVRIVLGFSFFQAALAHGLNACCALWLLPVTHLYCCLVSPYGWPPTPQLRQPFLTTS